MKPSGFVAGMAAVVLCSPTCAQSIFLDFGDFNPAPSSSFVSPTGTAGTWNQVITTGTTSHLVDSSGRPTGVAITLSTPGVSLHGHAPALAGDVGRLVGDNFYAVPNQAWSFEITGLADGTYSAYAYGNLNPAVPTGSFDVNGRAVASLGVASGSDLLLNRDYRLIDGLVVTDGKVVVLSTNGSAATFSGLSGFQLVSTVPELPTAPLIALGLAAVLAGSKRRPGRARALRQDAAPGRRGRPTGIAGSASPHRQAVWR